MFCLKNASKYYSLIIKIITVSITLFLFLTGCGEGIVDIGAHNYAPKIVVEGYLYPNTKPFGIKIGRNFPVNTIIDSNALFLDNATASIIDISSGSEYPLIYNHLKRNYYYPGNDFLIAYGKTYKLKVSAVIDGKKLETSSITTTPLKGMMIDLDKSYLNNMKYREKDEFGKLKNFSVVFSTSPQTEFYVIALNAVDASVGTFILDNPFFNDTSEVLKNLEFLKYQYRWQQNVQSSVGVLKEEISWLNIWFYGRYQVIVYAGDKNFKDYLLTHNSVMEMDGNLHEPRFHFEGDGIGVFGSAIADTTYFRVLK